MILFNLLKKKKKRQRLKITSIFSLNIWDNRREGKLILTSHLFPLLSFLFSCLSVEFWFTLFVRDTSCSINRFCLQVEKTKVKLWFNYHLLRQKILYYQYYYNNAKPLKLQKSCKTKETSSSTTFSFYFLCEFHLYYPEIKAILGVVIEISQDSTRTKNKKYKTGKYETEKDAVQLSSMLRYPREVNNL